MKVKQPSEIYVDDSFGTELHKKSHIFGVSQKKVLKFLQSLFFSSKADYHVLSVFF